MVWALMSLSEGCSHLSDRGEPFCRGARFCSPHPTPQGLLGVGGFQAPLGRAVKEESLYGLDVPAVLGKALGQGGSREGEAEPTQSSGSSVGSLCPSWACAHRPEFPEGGSEQVSPPPLFHKSTQTLLTTHCQAHTNTTSTCPQTHTTHLPGQPPRLIPTSTRLPSHTPPFAE